MSHITYNEFKNRFGDLGITKYTKAMWLEEGCEEIGKYVIGTVTSIETLSTATGIVKRIIIASVNDMATEGLRLTKGIYSQNFNTVSDGRTFSNTKAYDIYTNESNVVYAQLPGDWTDAQCQAYLKDKVILYKKKGYYAFTFTNYDRNTIVYDKTKPITITLLERTVIDKGTSPDVGTVAYDNGKTAIRLSVGQTKTLEVSTGALDQPFLFANNTQNESPGYKVKVRLKVEQNEVVINPAIKIEGQLGRFLNAQGEWTTGSTSLGSFKYEVSGGHTYDVVNAKAASSSYIMFLDADGNRIGNVVAMTSTNYPKVGDTRPMAMPDNCKYVWLVMASANVDLPIPLLA